HLRRPPEGAAGGADGSDVEPWAGEPVAAAELRIADEVGTVGTGVAVLAGVAVAGASLEGQAAHDGPSDVELPSAQDPVVLEERQLHRSRHHEDVLADE